MKKPTIDRAIDAVGSLTELASRLKADPQVIVNWRKRGIPPLRVIEVEQATVPRDEQGRLLEGAPPRVTRHELRPDLYPAEEEAA